MVCFHHFVLSKLATQNSAGSESCPLCQWNLSATIVVFDRVVSRGHWPWRSLTSFCWTLTATIWPHSFWSLSWILAVSGHATTHKPQIHEIPAQKNNLNQVVYLRGNVILDAVPQNRLRIWGSQRFPAHLIQPKNSDNISAEKDWTQANCSPVLGTETSGSSKALSTWRNPWDTRGSFSDENVVASYLQSKRPNCSSARKEEINEK